MKVLMKTVSMICLNDTDGKVFPLKFKWTTESGETQVIRIQRIVSRKEERQAGNPMQIFVVESLIEDILHLFEMKYESNTCKWYLYKM